MKTEIMMLREKYATIDEALEAFKGLTQPYQEHVVRSAIQWELDYNGEPIPDAVTMFICRDSERGAEFLGGELQAMLDIAWDTHRAQGTPDLGLRINDRSEKRQNAVTLMAWVKDMAETFQEVE